MFKKDAVRIIGLVLVVLAASSLAAVANTEDANDPSKITLERLFDSKDFRAESFGPARWLEDGSGYITLEDSKTVKGGKDIVKYRPDSGKREVLVAAELLIPDGEEKPLSIADYKWSNDGKKLLIFTNTRKVWRLHTRGDYWMLNLHNSKLVKLGGDAEPATLMFAKFSPNSRRVAYVHEKNIYVQNLRNLKIRKLTDRPSQTIINGTSDWVYEEEFHLRDGFRWSPNSKWIAYWQFDTSGVREFTMINNTANLYPELTRFKYPKVGQTNSACRVGVIHVGGGQPRWFEVSDDLRNHYIPRMDWAADSRWIVLQQLNRLQNTNQVILCNILTGKTRNVFTDKDEAWLDVHGDIKWLNNGKSFLWLSERDGWRHIYLISRRTGKAESLTPVDYDVIDVQAVDRKGGWIYFIASPQNPTQRYLYRVALDGPGEPERLTPEKQPGTHQYQISDDCKWAFHTYSTFDKGPVKELIRLPQHSKTRTLVDNKKLNKTLSRLDRSKTEFFRVEIDDGVELDAWCIKPPDFDPDGKYPLLVYVYGEPAGQTVLDRWGNQKYLWHLMLAQQGYIVLSIDNRGTPAPRGRKWRKCVYRQIGILASADQAAAVRSLIQNRPYIDPDRIAVWGWSGGGSMTLNALFRYPDLYQTGMAIAFVANQRYYDTIYQERYMGLPDDNAEGFEKGSPITYADQLEGNLLLVYGTGDDNCHYQNCEALVNKLIQHNKEFSMMSYPNRSHSINEGSGTRRHLYELLTRYLKQNTPPGRR